MKKNKFILIILIIIILINNITLINSCDVFGQILKCSQRTLVLTLTNGIKDTIIFDKNFSYNISSYPNKRFLSDQYIDGESIVFNPEVIINPIPTSGGKIPMIGYFLLDGFGNLKSISNSIGDFYHYEPINGSSKIDYLIDLPAGCKAFQIINFQSMENLTTIKYLPPTLSQETPIEFDPNGYIIINGENFSNDSNCVNIKLSSTTFKNSNSTPNSFDTTKQILNFNKISFPLFEAKEFVGQWNITIKIGDSKIQVPTINNLPTIKGNPDTIPRTGGVITLYGDFLKSRTNQISIVVGGDKQCKNIKYPNNDKIMLTCEMPSGNGGNYPLILTVDGIQCKDEIFFSYNQPTIKSIIIPSPDSNPYRLQVDGFYFTCSNDTKLKVKFYNSVNQSTFKYVVPNVLNDTQLLVDVPSYAYSGLFQMDVVNNSDSKVLLKSNDFKLLVNPLNNSTTSSSSSMLLWKPVIQSVSHCQTLGGIITFSGHHLRKQFYDGSPIEIIIKGNTTEVPNIDCNNITQGDGSTLACKINGGIGIGNFKIKINGEELPEVQFSYFPPTISSLTQIDDKIIMTGSNFGSNESDLFINYLHTSHLFNPISISLNQSLATIEIPKSIEKVDYFSIVVGGQYSNYTSNKNGSVSFSIHPVIKTINKLTTSGGILKLTGYFLSNDSIVTIGSIGCLNETILSLNDETELTCVLPGILSTIVFSNESQSKFYVTSGTNHRIKLVTSTNAIESFNPNNLLFSYDPPIVNTTTTISEEGGLIHLTGTSFNNVGLFVTVGNVTCENPYSDNFDSVSCYIPPFTPILSDNSTQWINITVDGQTNSFFIFNYNFTKAISFEVKQDNISSYYKWLIPVVIIGVLVIVLAVVYSVYMFKKFQRLKKIKEMMNPKPPTTNPPQNFTPAPSLQNF
ncbi:hypothetical protein RB653_003805 [Dictyostelium firmibasis]|uniref:IPT/TIG domain-containing protein n=1 Tax=Dictyostelium firmibasis TaxID=79012 RepID=A0AAN7U5D2_9MYCE